MSKAAHRPGWIYKTSYSIGFQEESWARVEHNIPLALFSLLGICRPDNHYLLDRFLGHKYQCLQNELVHLDSSNHHGHYQTKL